MNNEYREFMQNLITNYCHVISSYRVIKPFHWDKDHSILDDIRFEEGKVIFTVPSGYKDFIYIPGLSQKRTCSKNGMMEIYYKINGKNNYAEELMRASMLFRDWCYKAHDLEYCWSHEA